MSKAAAQRNPGFDPFGEPMDLPAVCTDPKGYGETRRVAIVFWVLALIFLGGRVYLSDPLVEQSAAAPAAVPAVQVANIH